MPKPSWLLKEFSINDFGRIAEARVEHTLTSQEQVINEADVMTPNILKQTEGGFTNTSDRENA